jgi:zinc D-Ala-D-Ala carboxypeptidase
MKNETTQLSPNFTLDEFKVSAQYPELAKKIKFSTVDIHQLKLFCTTILQPIRNEFGVVNILSGKRSPELNSAVGGSSNSDHLTCCAADFTIDNHNLFDVYNWIILESGITFRQLIYYVDKRFIHISINSSAKEFKNNQSLLSVKGTYIPFFQNEKKRSKRGNS